MVSEGVFDFLDHREKASQPPVNPLVTNVPPIRATLLPDIRKAPFPNPRLEGDERGQLNGSVLQKRRLYSYGWVDEKAGTVRIPIERAMDLIAQRGLPVRAQGATAEAADIKRRDNREEESNQAGAAKTKKGDKK